MQELYCKKQNKTQTQTQTQTQTKPNQTKPNQTKTKQTIKKKKKKEEEDHGGHKAKFGSPMGIPYQVQYSMISSLQEVRRYPFQF